MKNRLKELILQLDYASAISGIKVAHKNDVMSYIGIQTEYRSTVFASSLMMAFGLILMMLSLPVVSTLVCIISVSLLAPTCMTLTYH